MLHFRFAQVVQVWLPLAVLREVGRHALGQKNVTRVATIHHALRHVDAGAGHIRPVVHIDNLIDRAAIHPHAKLDFWAGFSTPPQFPAHIAPEHRHS